VRFAFITPRYGAEIVAGAEHACRLMAEGISERHDVEVLTTCAHDPSTWSNQHSEGTDRIRGVVVRRFPVSQPHDHIGFEQLSYRLFGSRTNSAADELDWLRRRGPWSPALLDHIKRQHRTYDALLYFSLLTPATFHGPSLSPERSVIFPCLTLHPALRFGIWKDVIASVRALGFLSSAERPIARAYLGPDLPPDEVVGVGVDAPPMQTYPRHQQDPADDPAEDDLRTHADEVQPVSHLAGRGVPFRRRHRLYGPFVAYADRVDADNGCEEMLEYFGAYTAAAGQDSTLVLTGVKMMKVPDMPHVRNAGVLPERERMVVYEAADVTLAPAPDDPLASSVLQSFAVGTPVLAAAANGAAVEHCRRANGGLYYANREEFVEALRLLSGDARLRERLGESGRQYVRQHYRWDAVLGRFERLISRVKAGN
jgi:glycosyltransferase involved in cell wall biosynthesis